MLEYIILFSIIILFLGASAYSNSQAQKRFDIEYSEFLSNNEGIELFCYTNREKFLYIIENDILPYLDESINIIKLVGKEPVTSLDVKFISQALYKIENIGFPNVMKVVNGELLDISLHCEIYNAINNGKSDELIELVYTKFEMLRL